jgi:predicted kinase
MRKWMRERLQRRKKKAAEQPSQPAPPPLQPAYFDEQAAAQPEPETPELAAAAEAAATREPEATPVESAAPSTYKEKPRSQPVARETGQRRSRRRRGVRGRGGREQAVAQAFAHKATSGTLPVATPEVEEQPAELPEAQAEAPAPAPEPPKTPATVPAATQRPPKGLVVLAIGLPGSGKSSWFKRHNVVPLSSDMMRSLLFDDVREQRFQDLVFSNLRSLLKARLIAKRPMNYVDATNLTPQERQHWIKLAKDYNYEVHAVFFDVPLEVCIERHQRRDRVVPEDIMRRMAAKLKPPSFSEGFAKITVVRVKKKEDAAKPEGTPASSL